MGVEFGRATTPDDIAAVQRLRHAVYVEEMGRYEGASGVDDGVLAEPEDEYSWLFMARDGDQIVASTRMTWGGDGFSERQISQYQLAPFLAELPAELLGVGERNTVLPSYRGTGVFEQLMAESLTLYEQSIPVVFGCCEPHLLSLFLRVGSLTYAERNINSPEAGYLIPLISFVPDVESLRGLGRETPDGELPKCVSNVLDSGGAIRHQGSSPTEFWGEVHATLSELNAEQFSMFDGLDNQEAQRAVERSTIIECSAGDRVLKKGGTARNIFVVLSGVLEVRDDDGRPVAVVSQGETFGELAFLLERTRTMNVDAVADNTRVLCFSERALRAMIDEEPTVAAKLLLNLSKALCAKLIRAT